MIEKKRPTISTIVHPKLNGQPLRTKLAGGALLLVSVFMMPMMPFLDTASVALAQSDEASERVTVIRIYFEDRATVDAIAQDYAPWEVHHDEGYLIIGVSDDELEELTNQGLQIEIDEPQTSYYRTQRASTAAAGIPDFPCYRTVEETYASARNLAARYPRLARWIDIGDSWVKQNSDDGYDLFVLKLTNADVPGPKPALFQMTAVHAREYTTAELNTRFAEYLLSHYGRDADATWLLDHHEFHLVLQSNPDGRKRAEAGALWRKNTNQNFCLSIPNLRGIDLNRNFSFNWGCCGGSSTNACSQTFRGPEHSSEAESSAIMDYVRSVFPDRRAPEPDAPAPTDASGIFLDTHSFSELVLWPWGHTRDLPPNNEGLVALGRKLARFNDYRPAQGPDLYITDGTTTDFSYGELGIASYTFELGTTFFQQCSDFENEILPDNLNALLYAAKAVRAPYTQGQAPDPVDLSVTPEIIDRGNSATLRVTLDDTRYNNSNGVQTTQSIIGAEAYIDVPPWDENAQAIPLNAADGRFDDSIEQATTTIDTSSLAIGRHTIFVRGRDADGHWGIVSARFLTVRDGSGGIPPAVFASNLQVDESEGSANVAVSLSSPSQNQVQVTAFTRAGTANGGTDFYGKTETLAFAPGETRKSFTVQILDDSQPEPPERFSVLLAQPTNAEIEGGAATVVVTDDDDASDRSVELQPVTVREDVGSARVPIKLSAASRTEVSVLAFTQRNTATQGEDYYGASSRITFAPGVTEQFLPVTILNDLEEESDESVFVRLANANNAKIATPDPVLLTIKDNDNGETAVLNVSSVSTTESVGAVRVPVSLTQPSATDVSFKVFTRRRTAIGGTDYYGLTQELSIPPGQTRTSVEITIVNDTNAEPDEVFEVRLIDVQNANQGQSGTVTIRDDD